MPAPRPHWTIVVLLAAWVALLGLGFAGHAQGCQWGTDAYACAGVAVVALAVVLPWVRPGASWLRRLQLAVAFGFASLAVAVAGFWIAGLPLFCP